MATKEKCVIPHRHVRGETDNCLVCGEDIRHAIHFRMGETLEGRWTALTEQRDELLAALEALLREFAAYEMSPDQQRIAKLIAAAPDTAEACRAMAILIEDDHKRHCNNDNTDGPITDCDPEDCYLRSRWDKVHNAAKKAGVL